MVAVVAGCTTCLNALNALNALDALDASRCQAAYLVQLNRGWVATSVLVGQGDGIDGAVDQIFRGTDAVGGGGANKVKRTGVVQWLQVKTLLGGLFLVRLKIRYRRKKISKKDFEKRFQKTVSMGSYSSW